MKNKNPQNEPREATLPAPTLFGDSAWPWKMRLKTFWLILRGFRWTKIQTFEGEAVNESWMLMKNEKAEARRERPKS